MLKKSRPSIETAMMARGCDDQIERGKMSSARHANRCPPVWRCIPTVLRPTLLLLLLKPSWGGPECSPTAGWEPCTD
jgi:hypothetical protein